MGIENIIQVNGDKWYSAREAATFLTVTEGTVKKYCRAKILTSKRIGPHNQWHVLGQSIRSLREKWDLDSIHI
jgi:hypothetical protein